MGYSTILLIGLARGTALTLSDLGWLAVWWAFPLFLLVLARLNPLRRYRPSAGFRFTRVVTEPDPAWEEAFAEWGGRTYRNLVDFEVDGQPARYAERVDVLGGTLGLVLVRPPCRVVPHAYPERNDRGQRSDLSESDQRSHESAVAALLRKAPVKDLIARGALVEWRSTPGLLSTPWAGVSATDFEAEVTEKARSLIELGRAFCAESAGLTRWKQPERGGK